MCEGGSYLDSDQEGPLRWLRKSASRQACLEGRLKPSVSTSYQANRTWNPPATVLSRHHLVDTMAPMSTLAHIVNEISRWSWYVQSLSREQRLWVLRLHQHVAGHSLWEKLLLIGPAWGDLHLLIKILKLFHQIGCIYIPGACNFGDAILGLLRWYCFQDKQMYM